MPTTKRKGLPEVWTTGLAKLLVGSNPCQFQAWIKAHYRIEKVQRDETKLTDWKIQHTAALTKVTEASRADGWKCDVERYFRVPGRTAILTGKTDLILQKKDARPMIVDVKGGEPTDSDVAQVQIYQIAIPLAWQAPGMQFDGLVVYATHSVKIRPEDAFKHKARVFAMLRQLGSEQQPPASPSPNNCKWCDVSKEDCPDRIDETESVEILTSEF